MKRRADRDDPAEIAQSIRGLKGTGRPVRLLFFFATLFFAAVLFF